MKRSLQTLEPGAGCSFSITALAFLSCFRCSETLTVCGFSAPILLFQFSDSGWERYSVAGSGCRELFLFLSECLTKCIEAGLECGPGVSQLLLLFIFQILERCGAPETCGSDGGLLFFCLLHSLSISGLAVFLKFGSAHSPSLLVFSLFILDLLLSLELGCCEGPNSVLVSLLGGSLIS